MISHLRKLYIKHSINNLLKQWVIAHKGNWNNEDWLGLLDLLKKLKYISSNPSQKEQDVIGIMLEIKKAEYVVAKYKLVLKRFRF